jgi:hypothetical protein
MRVEPITSDILGFVKSTADGVYTARQMYAEVLIGLASRAMERIAFSPAPENDKVSYACITPMSSGDIEAVTKKLLTMAGKCGLSSEYGPINRAETMIDPNTTQQTPEPIYDWGRDIAHRLENFLVKEFLALHPREWYLKKFDAVARQGRLTEKEFYDLAGLPHVDGTHYRHSPDLAALRGAPVSPDKTSRDNLDRAIRHLLRLEPGQKLYAGLD